MDKKTGQPTLFYAQHKCHAATWNSVSKEARDPSGKGSIPVVLHNQGKQNHLGHTGNASLTSHK